MPCLFQNPPLPEKLRLLFRFQLLKQPQVLLLFPDAQFNLSAFFCFLFCQPVIFLRLCRLWLLPF